MEWAREDDLSVTMSKIYAKTGSLSAIDHVHHALYEMISIMCKVREGMVELDQEEYNDIPFRIDEIAWNLSFLVAYMNKGVTLPEEDILLTASRFKYLLQSVSKNHPYWKL